MDALDRSARHAIATLLHSMEDRAPATREQRKFFLNEYLAFLSSRLEVPEPRILARDLVDLGYARAWLAAAAAGYTRQRPVKGSPDAAHTSQLARSVTFNQLAKHLGEPVRLDARWPAPQKLPPEESKRLVELLADNQPPRTDIALWERTSAVAALAAATGQPLAKLARLHLDDLDWEAVPPTVTVGRTRAKGKVSAGAAYGLDQLYARVIRRWVERHAQLTAELEGGVVTALWITVHPAGRGREGQAPKHPYLPCSVRALRHSQHTLTSRLLGRHTRIGQLTAPLDDEDGEDDGRAADSSHG